jgi:hypothetical protein
MSDARRVALTAAGGPDDDLVALTRRIARSVQTTVGWIFWDPGAIRRYVGLGLPETFAGPLGYIAARCAPLAGAGPEAVIAAFGSISAAGVRAAFDVVGPPERFAEVAAARDAAVLDGLRAHAPDIVHPLVDAGPALWDVVDQLPLIGRVCFGAHRAVPRPDDPLLSGWHAVNCLREWRGDTHWALLVAAGLDHHEASILHNAWLGYEPDWLPRSRGATDVEIDAGWAALEARGLARDRRVLPEGVALRQRIEDDTDRLTTRPWALLGPDRAAALADALEPPCERLLARVDETAGPSYQPASRIR